MSRVKRFSLTERMMLLAAVFAAAVMLVMYAGTSSVAAEDSYDDLPVMECGKEYTVNVPYSDDGYVAYRFNEKNDYETSTDYYHYHFKFTIKYVTGSGEASLHHYLQDGGSTGPIFEDVGRYNPSMEYTATFVGAYDDMYDVFQFENYSGDSVTVTLRVDKIVSSHSSKTPAAPAAPAVGTTAAVSGGTVKVISGNTAEFTKAQNKKSVTVPATAVISGKTYAVTQIGAKAFTGKKIRTVSVGANINKIAANAFKGSKATKMIVKTKLLKKAFVKKCLKGSKVKTVQVKVGSKKINKKFVKAYKKIFKKGNSGKKVKVK